MFVALTPLLSDEKYLQYLNTHIQQELHIHPFYKALILFSVVKGWSQDSPRSVSRPAGLCRVKDPPRNPWWWR